jgi:hypothetical protein
MIRWKYRHVFCPKVTDAPDDYRFVAQRKILNGRRFVSQEVATFSEASAPTLRERHEPFLGLLCSDNHLIQLCCLSGREIVPERGRWLAEGGVFPKGSNLRQGKASPFGISNEFHLI